MGGLERLAITGACGDHFNDPAGAVPICLDVIRRFFRSQIPGDVTDMTDPVIGCPKRDLAISKQLIAELPVEASLVRFQGQ